MASNDKRNKRSKKDRWVKRMRTEEPNVAAPASKNARKRAKRRKESGMLPAEERKAKLRRELARSKYDAAPGTWIRVWRG